jgi:hypothetical protein
VTDPLIGPAPQDRIVTQEEAERQAGLMDRLAPRVPRFQVAIERRDTGEEVGLPDLLPTHVLGSAPQFVLRFIHDGREVMTFECHRIEMAAGAPQAFARMLDLANREVHRG